jgi:hypothetical protein
MKESRGKVCVLTWFLAAPLLMGCTVAPKAELFAASGTFHGVTAKGEPVVIVLQQEAFGVRGHGRVGDSPIAISAVQTWTAVGALLRDADRLAWRTISLTADGNTLVLEMPGERAVMLARGGQASGQPPGPFSGRYQAVGSDDGLAEVRLTQEGSLIAGVGTVLGQPVGVAARTTSATIAEGILSFSDGSQARFGAEMAADGQSVTVRGLGQPVLFRRF